MPVGIDEAHRPVILKDPGFAGGWGIGITTACKDPERAFEFLDWMCSEEAQILTHWGIEGVNYTVVNGKRIVSDEEYNLSINDPDYGKKTGIGYWTAPFPQRGTGYIDSTGNYITTQNPDIIKRNYIDVERETLKAYGAEMWTDLFIPPEQLGDSRWGQAWQITLTPEINLFYMEAHEITEAAVGNLIYSPPAQFNTIWAKYVNDLKAIGMDQANARMTALVKGRVQLWEGKAP
jgi:putative aldouronate transport system substrate-binding protein